MQRAVKYFKIKQFPSSNAKINIEFCKSFILDDFSIFMENGLVKKKKRRKINDNAGHE